MSNTVGNWDDGMPTGLGSGNGSRPYPEIKLEWNQPTDDDNHDEILSPTFDFPLRGDCINFLVNTKALDTSTSATFTLKIYGSADNSTFTELDSVDISNGDFDGKLYIHKYDVSTKGLAPYMKLGLNPSADPGAVDIYVGVFNSQHAH